MSRREGRGDGFRVLPCPVGADRGPEEVQLQGGLRKERAWGSATLKCGQLRELPLKVFLLPGSLLLSCSAWSLSCMEEIRRD